MAVTLMWRAVVAIKSGVSIGHVRPYLRHPALSSAAGRVHSVPRKNLGQQNFDQWWPVSPAVGTSAATLCDPVRPPVAPVSAQEQNADSDDEGLAPVPSAVV